MAYVFILQEYPQVEFLLLLALGQVGLLVDAPLLVLLSVELMLLLEPEGLHRERVVHPLLDQTGLDQTADTH